jgi:hypothetical protein
MAELKTIGEILLTMSYVNELCEKAQEFLGLDDLKED